MTPSIERTSQPASPPVGCRSCRTLEPTSPGPLIYERVIQGDGNNIAAGVIPLIKETKGIQLIGPLPAELQTYQINAAALMTGAASPATAKRFISWLVGPTAKALFAANYVE